MPSLVGIIHWYLPRSHSWFNLIVPRAPRIPNSIASPDYVFLAGMSGTQCCSWVETRHSLLESLKKKKTRLLLFRTCDMKSQPKHNPGQTVCKKKSSRSKHHRDESQDRILSHWIRRDLQIKNLKASRLFYENENILTESKGSWVVLSWGFHSCFVGSIT